MITSGSPGRPHWTGFIDGEEEDFYIELFSPGARGLLLPAVQFLEFDFDINQNTWRIAAGGGRDPIKHCSPSPIRSVRPDFRSASRTVK